MPDFLSSNVIFYLETRWPNKSLLLSISLHRWGEASVFTGCSSHCIPSSADERQRGFLPRNRALEVLCIACAADSSVGCFILPFITQQRNTKSPKGILPTSLLQTLRLHLNAVLWVCRTGISRLLRHRTRCYPPATCPCPRLFPQVQPEQL